jgi:hypothetical protein
MGAQDQRPRFYEGQYLAAGDLAALVEYLRAADARHALGEHTWGIAIGLYLVERPAPGATDRKEIILLPGVAWDGFGRAIVVTRPTRLPEELFASVPFDGHLDATSSGANPKGRAVRVWLNYSEVAARQPASGFESCAEDDQNARVAETFEFVVGAVAASPNRQGNVMMGTETLPAEEALSRFDPTAAPLYDAAVPHQIFPAAKHPPRWLVPVGFVRWVAREEDLGYFVSRDGAPEYGLKDCTRAFRRYIGAVVENLVAADGAIVLQRRDKNPKDRHKLAYLLNCGHKSEELLDDLAWIEGNLRVVGNAKLAGGKLLMRDADGFDEGVPIYFERTGDDPTLETKKCCDNLDAVPGAADSAAADLAKAPRELRAAIGKKGQNAHRFIVGPEAPPDATKGEKAPSLAPRFVVLSGSGETDNKDAEGRAGVNTRDPNAALEVKGDWNGQDGAIRVAGTQPTIRYEGGADVSHAKWIAQLTATPKGAYRIAYRTSATPPAWRGVVNILPEKVGIRSDAPSAPLTVRADGAAEDLVAFEDIGGAAKWKIRLKPDSDHPGLTFTEVSGNKNSVFLKPGGDVGIGTVDPQGRLTVYGKVQPAQGQISFFTGTADVEYDGGDDNLFLWRQTPAGATSFLNTRIGIGSTAPTRPLAVRGASATEELVSFEDAAGATKWHINQKLDAAIVKGLNFAETGVADGRLFIREGGNVGIGTFEPQQKLHVAGDFLLVDGKGDEQAYIGGDATIGSTVGTAYETWFVDLLDKYGKLDDANKAKLSPKMTFLGVFPLPKYELADLKQMKDNPLTSPILFTLAYADGIGMTWPPPNLPADAGKSVQIGSFNAAVNAVHLWNTSTSNWMSVGCQALFVPSDARLKTDVAPLEGSLGKVMRLCGVAYRHARPESGAGRQIGLIAQEVAEVFPEAVSTLRGMQAISYTTLVPVLIEAVKELKAELDDLRGQVRKLSGGGPKKKSLRA